MTIERRRERDHHNVIGLFKRLHSRRPGRKTQSKGTADDRDRQQTHSQTQAGVPTQSKTREGRSDQSDSEGTESEDHPPLQDESFGDIYERLDREGYGIASKVLISAVRDQAMQVLRIIMAEGLITQQDLDAIESSARQTIEQGSGASLTSASLGIECDRSRE
jgi:hypothetical protein